MVSRCIGPEMRDGEARGSEFYGHRTGESGGNVVAGKHARNPVRLAQACYVPRAISSITSYNAWVHAVMPNPRTM